MNEQFFTSLNGYKVKDEYAIHTYDSVALMKADTKLKEGMHVKTKGYYSVNDGGSSEYIIKSNSDNYYETLNNELLAELISENDTINVKQLGAKGDGETDDTTAIQNAVNLNKHLFFPEGTYKLTSSINITGKLNWNFDCKLARIEYSGNNYAFVFKHIINSNLDFGVITASNGGCISFEGDTSSNNSQYVNISFLYFSCSTNCINALCTGDSWLNEFRISKGRLAGGTNGIYLLHNSSLGLSNWTFSELGIEGVTQGFLFEVGSYAETNDRYITSLNFINCRTHESANTIKTIGKVLKGLIIQSRYMNPSQFNISSDTTDWKIIHADRTNYIHNGVLYENEIDISNDVTTNENLNYEATSVLMTDNYATVRSNITAKNSDISMTNDYLIMSGLPKPKSNVYFLAFNYAQSYENPIRLRLNTNGELRAYWPGTCSIHTGSYPLVLNITYPLKVFGIQSR